MNRRDALLALGALPLLACTEPGSRSMTQPASTPPKGAATTRMPALFAAHGAPILLDDAVWMAELAAWGRALPRPKAILVVSAHWEARPATIGATTPVPLVYDFYGFPPKYYEMTYAAPGAPELATRVRELLRAGGLPSADDPRRGLDHGAYVPLMAMFPAADVPVLQLSMPRLDPAELLALGRALAPLRDEGVIVFGSGFLTHNMRFAFKRGVPGWAREFDAWAEEAIAKLDVDALADFRVRAPAAAMALPTWEHYAPLLVAVGALGDDRPKVSFPISGFWMEGAFTKRSAQLG